MLIRWILILLLSIAPAISTAAQTILVFGDSLSVNDGGVAEAGWVSQLQQRLGGKPYEHQVVNASISGETTASGAARIHAMLDAHKPDIIIIELGINDGLRGRSLIAAKDNLDAIMEASLARKARVLLIGMRLPGSLGLTYTESFAAIFPALASKHGSVLVPFMLEGISGKRDLLQADGLHPTAEAQKIILENVWSKLKLLL